MNKTENLPNWKDLWKARILVGELMTRAVIQNVDPEAMHVYLSFALELHKLSGEPKVGADRLKILEEFGKTLAEEARKGALEAVKKRMAGKETMLDEAFEEIEALSMLWDKDLLGRMKEEVRNAQD